MFLQRDEQHPAALGVLGTQSRMSLSCQNNMLGKQDSDSLYDRAFWSQSVISVSLKSKVYLLRESKVHF